MKLRQWTVRLAWWAAPKEKDRFYKNVNFPNRVTKGWCCSILGRSNCGFSFLSKGNFGKLFPLHTVEHAMNAPLPGKCFTLRNPISLEGCWVNTTINLLKCVTLFHTSHFCIIGKVFIQIYSRNANRQGKQQLYCSTPREVLISFL